MIWQGLSHSQLVGLVKTDLLCPHVSDLRTIADDCRGVDISSGSRHGRSPGYETSFENWMQGVSLKLSTNTWLLEEEENEQTAKELC